MTTVSPTTNTTSYVSSRLYYGGAERQTEKKLSITHPAKPSEVVGEAAAATRDQTLAAVAAAKVAFLAWAALSGTERADCSPRPPAP